jgi:hypothetical protein
LMGLMSLSILQLHGLLSKLLSAAVHSELTPPVKFGCC